MSVDEKMLIGYGVNSSELEGYINYAKNISGVEVGVFFYHTLDGETKVVFGPRISMFLPLLFPLVVEDTPVVQGVLLQGKPDEIEKMVIQKISELID